MTSVLTTPAFLRWRADLDEALLARFSQSWPAPFAKALQYPINTGGKRVRPALALAAFEAVGGNGNPVAARDAGMAVELIHTYSLAHDDLPMLDNDDSRRGHPTLHIVHDEPTALLVGDALLTEAFSVLAELNAPAEVRIQLVASLASAAGHLGMVGGQAADVGLGGAITTVEDLTRLHNQKTGALLTAAILMGGLVGGATEPQLVALRNFGAAIGLAFQVADDILDNDEDTGVDGPPTFPKLIGLEATQALATTLRDRALDALKALPDAQRLEALAHFIIDRDH